MRNIILWSWNSHSKYHDIVPVRPARRSDRIASWFSPTLVTCVDFSKQSPLLLEVAV